MSVELFSMGELYVSDFIKPDEQPRHEPVEMKLMMDSDGVVHLEKSAPKETMWGKYWYRSSINSTMRQQLADVVGSVLKVIPKKDGQIWADIAANDGYLLSCVPNNFLKVGIDPADDSYRIECEKYADLVIQDYFSAEVYKSSKYGDRKVDVVTCISMLYDIQDTEAFLRDVYEIMNKDAVAVFQLSYSPLMIQQMAYDNLCHEHYKYFSLFNLKSILERCGFVLLDCQLNDTNAGSFRIFVMKDIGNKQLFGNSPYRDVCKYRTDAILCHEKQFKIDLPETWKSFYRKSLLLKKIVISFIKDKKEQGKTIAGYGASTKGNTTLQFFGLDNSFIDYIADRSTYKHGLVTVGTQILIISEDEMRKKNPDYLLVLPFHFISEFIEREKDYLLSGGSMIVCSPEFRVITKDDL